ncbi:MAG TPA: GNAT family N-acetyltransferase [Abditibacteriaceae bacterium]
MVTIRQAQPGDMEAIFRLARDFATSFVPEEDAFRTSFAAVLGDPDACLLVAEIDEYVVAYVLAFFHHTFYANGRVAWVEEIMVHENYRKHGIGKRLMDGVENWAAEQNCKLIALATRRASNFYEAIGYEASATYYRKLI